MDDPEHIEPDYDSAAEAKFHLALAKLTIRVKNDIYEIVNTYLKELENEKEPSHD